MGIIDREIERRQYKECPTCRGYGEVAVDVRGTGWPVVDCPGCNGDGEVRL